MTPAKTGPETTRAGRQARIVAILSTASILYVGPLSAAVGRRELVRQVHVWSGLALPIPLLVTLAGAFRFVSGKVSAGGESR